MLKIQLEEASKRFQYEWIFKNLSLELSSGHSLAVTGSNGSGKSTLLKCLSGAIPISSGKISYSIENQSISETDWFSYLSIAAPYMEVPEEFSLQELLDFHFRFKKPLDNINTAEIIKVLYLEEHSQKLVGQFSSGMKQRVKLGLALFSDVPLIFLDEPTSNLDKKGIAWYQEMISQYARDRVMVICSNEPREYEFCEQIIALEDYK
ncbi:ATP-binding cassette domain-containing protein [Algoriphagus halophytocola]|uniref:ATP-binding cassette domain-containing protein n=1 Tax=Algoriphagus halophytocola TaxID=2991499 RepID=A0ABY6MFE9_9BACT|nr:MULTISPECIES: ATP-binding cassette domain-containing protein [unclassified Algoriphagus]UZD22553.1 ATP-binding cassette domain-containing protein [Algoriphagus sp. TR-M5]WBL43816.1 ATP-binding cassette domain-containing protein [Algoriphagus sp. TR-M9]